MASWLMVLLIVIPWLGALIAMLTKDEQEKLQHGIAVLFSLLAAGCAIILLFNSSAQAKVQLPIGGAFGVFTLVPDGLGVFLAAVAAIVGSLAVIFSTWTLLCIDSLLHWSDGWPGAFRQHALHVLLLGDHSILLLCVDLVLQ